MGVVGIDPDKYYKYTLKELTYIAEAYEREYNSVRQVEHAIYDVQYGFSGKKIFKDSWLRNRFPTLYKQEVIHNPDEANQALLAAGLVEKK